MMSRINNLYLDSRKNVIIFPVKSHHSMSPTYGNFVPNHCFYLSQKNFLASHKAQS